jgi:hypothetical protein
MQTVQCRANTRVRGALARKGMHVDEFCTLKGRLQCDHLGFRLYIPDFDLTVFLRKSVGDDFLTAIATKNHNPLPA